MATQNLQSLILNREVGLIKFYQRVLALALNKDIPLLERFKYLCITCRNLDELFEVRIPRLIKWSKKNPTKKFADDNTAIQSLDLVTSAAVKLYTTIYATYNSTLLPELNAAKINIYPSLTPYKLDKTQNDWLSDYFATEINPHLIITELDTLTSFPLISNKNLCFIFQLSETPSNINKISILEVPRNLPHIIQLPIPDIANFAAEYKFISLQDIIQLNLAKIFPQHIIKSYYPFRITRASDFKLNNFNHSTGIRETIIRGLARQKYALCSRIEIDLSYNIHPTKNNPLLRILLTKFNLNWKNVYFAHGPLNLSKMAEITTKIRLPKLKFPKFTPTLPKELINQPDIFKAMTRGDILIHTPYQSFDPVIELTRIAATDPQVLTIKMTVYRTGSDSQLVQNLIKAANNHKQVFASIELSARFDEKTNITLANNLEKAGAQVVYGMMGYKVHAKMLLIIRKEGTQLKSYVHLGTGNYHQHTAKMYSDFGLLTTNPIIVQDIESMFARITGMGNALPINLIYQSPFNLYDMMLHKITQETLNAKSGVAAKIMVKMNSLQEPKIIQALYLASQAGVKITLIIRGACALRPKFKQFSSNITVISIVGQFLEHHRILYFYNNGHEDVYLSSADWMKRNFFKRIETCIPILDQQIKRRIIYEGLNIYLKDNSAAWTMDARGNYTKRQPRKHGKIISAQNVLMHELNNQNDKIDKHNHE